MTKIQNSRGVQALLAVAAISLLAGCSSFQRSKDAKEKPITDLSYQVPEEGYKPSEQYGDVALDHKPRVDQWINYFTGRGRRYMHIYLERSARYIPMMKATFRERGMPDDLAYIAMIESGFSATAFSHASAVGYWQFIRETGKRYNLRIDQFIDERRDPILSTQAAANYLDSLYSLFGDWHLALCSYNAGERRILNAVMKHRTRDFWQLAKIRRGLPRETADYIPKFIAAVMIAKDPAKYGFTDINFHEAFAFDTVVIDRPISLDLLAAQLKVPFEELKRMNPRYKSDYVPVYTDRVNAVRVPVGMKDVAVAALPQTVTDAPRIYASEFEYYKVRRGDTLSHIARKYRTSIARILDLNGFSKRTLLRVGQRIKVPDGAPKVAVRETRNEARKKSPVKATNRQASNRKSPSKSLKGNSMEIESATKTARQDLKAEVKRDRQIARKVHIVRRGENLSTIARKYRTSVKEIAQANSLDRRTKIMAGHELIIPN